jgi:hypothetical protein
MYLSINEKKYIILLVPYDKIEISIIVTKKQV